MDDKDFDFIHSICDKGFDHFYWEIRNKEIPHTLCFYDISDKEDHSYCVQICIHFKGQRSDNIFGYNTKGNPIFRTTHPTNKVRIENGFIVLERIK